MKNVLTLFWAFLLAAFTLQAQQYDVLDQVRSDSRKARGMEGPHRLEQMGPLTKAPKGYKPFYITHYGRHGSRYAWNSDTYKIIHKVLAAADEKGVLTPYGQAFREKYEAFYMEPWINAGDLVPLGFEQHQTIGEFVYASFPEVFKKDRQVFAVSSTAQRCIVSMGAFNLGLKSGNPQLRITLKSTHDGMCIIAPPSAPRQLRKHFEGEKAEVDWESAPDFIQRVAPLGSLLDKLFTSQDFLEDFNFEGGKLEFVSELYELYCGYHNYEPQPLFDDLLTEDERVAAWEANNYSSFRYDITSRYSVIPLLQDILAKAESAPLDPSRAADLRFGHDYILEALVTLLNVNGMGTIPGSPEEVKYWFRNFDIPMAATLLFVFYQNRKGDILFKVLLNEQEATLPALTPVSGPYYRWSDFQAFANAIIAAHPEVPAK